MELSWKSLKNWALSPEDESADLQFYILNKHITQTALSWECGNVLKAVCVCFRPLPSVSKDGVGVLFVWQSTTPPPSL